MNNAPEHVDQYIYKKEDIKKKVHAKSKAKNSRL